MRTRLANSIYVSSKNKNFSSEVADATRRWKKAYGKKPLPFCWQGHLRAVGLKERAALHPSSRGGPQGDQGAPHQVGATRCFASRRELGRNRWHEDHGPWTIGLISRKRCANLRLYCDGAPAWPALCKARGLQNYHVAHSKFEFAKKVTRAKQPKMVVAGTQCIDRWWQALDTCIPREIASKTAKGGAINPKLLGYMWTWLWGYHLPRDVDFRKALAKICWWMAWLNALTTLKRCALRKRPAVGYACRGSETTSKCSTPLGRKRPGAPKTPTAHGLVSTCDLVLMLFCLLALSLVHWTPRCLVCLSRML